MELHPVQNHGLQYPINGMALPMSAQYAVDPLSVALGALVVSYPARLLQAT